MKILADISITELQGATEDKRFLVSHKENYFQCNSITADLLRILKDSPTKDEGINRFLKTCNEPLTFQQIKDLLDNIIMPKLNENSSNTPQFLYQHTLFKKNKIDYISDKLSFLFNPYITVIVLLLCISMNICFYVWNENILSYREGIDIFTLLLLLVLIFLSSLFHEIGHAAACKYFGISHGGIGIGFYINFPVLYTDVTNIWKLSRNKRCVVNLAGVYFQCLLLTMLLIIYGITKFYLLRYLIVIMDFSFLLTLNPFFKFDGYWIASDLLGVPNLRRRSKEAIQYLFNRIFHKNKNNETPYLFKIRPMEKVGFILYSVFVNLFMGYYCLYIIPLLVYRFTASFPDEIHRLILYLSNNINPPFALLRNILSQTLFITFLCFLIFNFIKKHIKNRYKINLK